METNQYLENNYIKNEEDLFYKQRLIKENILDKNYDKNKFFAFCMEHNPDKGDDLTNWTVEDITSTINEFIQNENYYQNNIDQKRNEINNTESMVNSIQLNMDQMKPEQINGNPSIIEIQCNIAEKNILNDKQIQVELKNPKSIEVGMLSSNYVVYELSTTIPPNTKWIVERRYNDFLWLRQTLVKVFPFYLIPPLPGKKMGGRRFESDFVIKRMKYLNIFLNNVINNEEFKATDIVFSFLNISDRSHFEEKKKEFNSLQPPLFIENTRTLNGKISISLDEDNNNKYFTNIKHYFELQYKIYERLNDDFNGFYKALNDAANNLEDVQKDFELLHLLNKRVQMKEELLYTFEEYGIFFKNWKRILFNQNIVIKNYIKDFFKYVQMEGIAFEEFIKNRENIKAEFDSVNTKLLAKKEKLWKQMDLTKWELSEDMGQIDKVLLLRDKLYAFSKMCSKETNDLNIIGKKLGYANKSSLDQLRNLIGKYQKTFIDNLKVFANEFYQTLNDGLNVWSKLASSVDA